MLMLTVKDNDYIMIDNNIKIRVVKAGVTFKLGIDAPKDVRILRQSVYEQDHPDVKKDVYAKSKKRYAPRVDNKEHLNQTLSEQP